MYHAKRFAEIGNFIAQSEFLKDKNIYLSAEDAYFRPNAKTSIIISRLSGSIVAPIELQFDVDADWVRAAEWRHKVIRLNPFTPREQAKNASLKLYEFRLSESWHQGNQQWLATRHTSVYGLQHPRSTKEA